MAALKVRIVPDPVLRKKCVRIPAVDSSVQQLIADMIQTMHEEGGVGLAAPQVGKSLRLIVIQMPDDEAFAVVNPEIIKREGEREIMEGCLSIPGYQGLVKRAVSVICKGLDSDGRPIRIKAVDLMAQALEHEIDHLDGILYTDYIENPEKLFRIDSTDMETSDLVDAPIK
ncbi:MAG: peptide deformylase [Dehalococcoidaceae bacterium]|nr:peptide deformylase [Dehalococcoidaceae bacterium]